MNRYLQKLHSLEHAAKPPNVKTGHPHPPSKPSKPPFEGFEGDRGCARSRILKPSALVLAMLQEHCPDHVELGRWQQAVEDGRRFLDNLGQTGGVARLDLPRPVRPPQPPARPHPSYRRLSPIRRDRADLAPAGAAGGGADREPPRRSRTRPAAITVYRKHNKPALGPIGDSLDDFK